jgi:ABC-2 type transport system permease protein
MNIDHLRAIVRKEFLHIIRDPGTLFLMTAGPVLLILILVYALTADVKHVPIAVVDLANNARSQALIQRVESTGVVDVTQHLGTVEAADPLLEHNQIRAVLVIPQDYGQVANLLFSKLPQLRIVVDGTEPVSAEHVTDAIYTASDAELRKFAADTLSKLPGFDQSLLELPVKVSVERRYNPDLRAVVDFFPGLTAVVLSLPGIALTLTLAREKELGTMEQLVATPINKISLLLGKLAPYMVFGFCDVFVLVGIGLWLYGVPFRGSLAGYALIAMLFLFSNMSLGLLISILLPSQQLAVIVGALIFFFPSFFLSGVFFPLAAMPGIVQLELQMLPVIHFVTASKAIYLQGAPLGALWFDAFALFGLSACIFLVSVVLFRKKVA